MLIIPAIDLKEGKCVRLKQGQMEKSTVFSENPAEMARKWVNLGAQRLHLVDLDGAFAGKPVNESAIKSIVSEVGADIPIQLGGGIRNLDTVEKFINSGVDSVIIGTAAVTHPGFLHEACFAFPGQIVVGLDAKDGYLSVSGWKENSNQLTLDYLKEVNDYGVSRLIYTDINRDGMKQSPNFEETSKIAEISNCPVIISGGVSSIDDIKKAKNLKNVEGIIVGKAIYDGDIKLEELVKEDA